MEKTTHFGFQQVDVDQKQGLVKGVFDSVASNYDLMNDVMSLGTHRLWKNYTIASSNVSKGDKVLDIAGGTGDLAIKFRKKVGDSGKVILSDINGSMLEEGRKNLINHGVIDVDFIQKKLVCQSNQVIVYDDLIFALGSFLFIAFSYCYINSSTRF